MDAMTHAAERRRSGFTLIELMIAMSLLALGLLSMLALQLHAMRGSQLGRHYTQAAQIARDRMELIQRLPWDDAAAQPAAWTTPIQEQAMVDSSYGPTQEQSYDVSWEITADPTRPTLLREVSVRIEWYEANDDPGNPPLRRYAISSMKYNES